MNYKYALGQSVLVMLSDRWMGDGDIPCVITGYAAYTNGAMPVYAVRTHYGSDLTDIDETRIKETI